MPTRSTRRIHAEQGDVRAALAAIASARSVAASTPSTELIPKFWFDLTAAAALAGDEALARNCAEHGAQAFCEQALSLPAELAETSGRLPWHVHLFAFLAGREVPLRLMS
jgi:hypothetical protein